MTNDFKKNILDYITNNVTPTQPQKKILFDEGTQYASAGWSGDILPTNYNELKYVGIAIPNEDVAETTVIYGYYYDTLAREYKGIITLLDSKLNPIKSFFQYDGGGYLRPILSLEQAEDNTFYGIDSTMNNSPTNRFIMLNNFSIQNSTGEYKINLRKTYNFSSNDYTSSQLYLSKCYKIYKNPTSSHYIFFGSYQFTMKVIELTVNVGESNDWNLKTFTSSSGTYYQNGTPIALFDQDDNVFWRFVVLDYGNPNYEIKSINKNYTATTTTTTTLTSNIYTIHTLYDYAFLDSNTVYYGYKEDTSSRICKYDYTNSENTSLTTFYGDDFKVIVVNSDVYMYDSNAGSIRTFTRLENDDVVDSIGRSFTVEVGENVEWFFVKANYNLVSIVGLTGNPNNLIDTPQNVLIAKDNYNPLTYSGLAYTDYNSMIPTQATLYSNASLVFARNLYNKTVNENITTSTIVVPNAYLNDANINTQKLLAETNSIMINTQNTITKNIYETGYFNFINILNVIDNNSNNLVLLNGVASYINENINTGTQVNCEDSFIGNLRVTYEDNSTMNTGLIWYKTSNKQAYTEFALTLTQPILQIDLMSNDFSTSYLTIIPDNLEVGNTYKFTQYLKIE